MNLNSFQKKYGGGKVHRYYCLTQYPLWYYFFRLIVSNRHAPQGRATAKHENRAGRWLNLEFYFRTKP
jgi:hypothetical protein